MTVREKVFLQLHGTGVHGLTAIQRVIFAAIVIAVVLAIVATEPELPPRLAEWIEMLERLLGVGFLVEYVARVWSIGFKEEFAGVTGRLRYSSRPLVVIDLIALIPFLLGATGSESFVLRVLRVLRLLAFSKLMRYSDAMKIVVGAVIQRRFELMCAILLAGMMILISSSVLYVVEGGAQPAVFGSILRSMWWSVSTLTTVGYGDAVPVTGVGKLFAGLTALAGIGMIAMPTGILAASFSEGFAKLRSRTGSSEEAAFNPRAE